MAFNIDVTTTPANGDFAKIAAEEIRGLKQFIVDNLRNPTALLEAIKTVDGADSGLDADLLDGVTAAAFSRVDGSVPFSALIAAPSFLTTGTFATHATSGLYSEWNRSGIGESSFLNRKGAGAGGFDWSEIDTANVRTEYMRLRSDFRLVLSGGTPGLSVGDTATAARTRFDVTLSAQNGGYVSLNAQANAATAGSLVLQTTGGKLGLNVVPGSPGGQNSFFAIGDSDTGIGWESDGQATLISNGQVSLRWAGGFLSGVTVQPRLSVGDGINSYLGPSSGATGFRTYWGGNLYFDGTNWRTTGDGGSNGAGAVLANYGPGLLNFIVVPSTGGTSQTISNATLNSFVRMQIFDNGNVSIGTSSNSQKLQVEGSIRCGITANPLYIGRGADLAFAPYNGSADLTLRSDTGNITLALGGNSRFAVTNTGHYAFGTNLVPSTTVPGASLFIAVGDTDTGFGWNADGILGLYGNNVRFAHTDPANDRIVFERNARVSNNASIGGTLNVDSLTSIGGGIRLRNAGGGPNVNAEGMWLTWNASNAGGESAIINQKGGGVGGFSFYESTAANDRTRRWVIDANGDMALGPQGVSKPVGFNRFISVGGTGNTGIGDNGANSVAVAANGTLALTLSSSLLQTTLPIQSYTTPRAMTQVIVDAGNNLTFSHNHNISSVVRNATGDYSFTYSALAGSGFYGAVGPVVATVGNNGAAAPNSNQNAKLAFVVSCSVSGCRIGISDNNTDNLEEPAIRPFILNVVAF